MSLKTILDGLKPEERRQLMYAFEHGIAQHIVLKDKKFIGVNVEHIKNLKVTERAGAWASGEIK